jgi:hypothetical protein
MYINRYVRLSLAGGIVASSQRVFSAVQAVKLGRCALNKINKMGINVHFVEAFLAT